MDKLWLFSFYLNVIVNTHLIITGNSPGLFGSVRASAHGQKGCRFDSHVVGWARVDIYGGTFRGGCITELSFFRTCLAESGKCFELELSKQPGVSLSFFWMKTKASYWPKGTVRALLRHLYTVPWGLYTVMVCKAVWNMRYWWANQSLNCVSRRNPKSCHALLF